MKLVEEIIMLPRVRICCNRPKMIVYDIRHSKCNSDTFLGQCDPSKLRDNSRACMVYYICYQNSLSARSTLD